MIAATGAARIQGSRRVTSIVFDPVGRMTSVPSSPSTRPRGGTAATSRRKMRARIALSGGGVKWVDRPVLLPRRPDAAGAVSRDHERFDLQVGLQVDDEVSRVRVVA